MMESEKNSKLKIEWIDLSRGFAIVLMILCHSMEWYSSALGTDLWLLPLLYSFHIPLFFLISGFLFRSEKNFGTFLIKMVKGFLLPYITFSCIILLCDFIKIYLFGSTDAIDFPGNIKSLIIQNHYNLLWFILTLMFVKIISFFICKIKNLTAVLIISLVFIVLAYLYKNFVDVKLFWCLDEIIYALPFFLFGYLLKTSGAFEKLFNIKYSFLYLVVGVIANVVNLKLNPEIKYVNMFKCDFGNVFLFYVAAVFMIFFFISITKKIHRIKLVNYIGTNSFIYYGLHLIAFQFIFHFLQPVFDGSVIMYIVLNIVSTILVLLIMTLASFIFNKKPFAYLIGKF